MLQFKVSGAEGVQAFNNIQRTRWDVHSSEPHPQGLISSQSHPFSIQEEKEVLHLFVYLFIFLLAIISDHGFRKQGTMKAVSAALRDQYTDKV